MNWRENIANRGHECCSTRCMLVRLLLPALLLASLSGCLSHTRDDDAGSHVDAPGCTGFAPSVCVSGCGSDFLQSSTCIDDVWACPPPLRDVRSCPPTCVGAQPPGCTCEGAMWVCPPPMACDSSVVSGGACSAGSSCLGLGECGRDCACRAGTWDCTEPPLSCFCRDAEIGASCAVEGQDCGGCCPAFGRPSSVVCSGGRWAALACPELVCPSICAADRDAALGEPCIGSAICGDSCCSATSCVSGTWTPGPAHRCLCEASNSFACGEGTCRAADQACLLDCLQEGGASCIPLSEDGTCASFDLPAGYACSETDGQVTIESNLKCTDGKP